MGNPGISKDSMVKSIEERLLYYVNKLPDLESLGENILEVIKKRGVDCDDVTSRELISTYVRLMESHERILALTVNLFENSFCREYLSEEERSFLILFSKMTPEEKQKFFLESIKRASY